MFDLCHRGGQPDVFTYSAGVKAYQKVALWQRAFGTVVEAHRQRSESDMFCVSALLDTCAKASQWKLASGTLRDMKGMSLEANVFSQNAVVSACDKGMQWDWSMELLAKIRKQGPEPDIVSYGTAITACETCSQWRISETFAALRFAWQNACGGFVGRASGCLGTGRSHADRSHKRVCEWTGVEFRSRNVGRC